LMIFILAPLLFANATRQRRPHRSGFRSVRHQLPNSKSSVSFRQWPTPADDRILPWSDARALRMTADMMTHERIADVYVYTAPVMSYEVPIRQPTPPSPNLATARPQVPVPVVPNRSILGAPPPWATPGN